MFFLQEQSLLRRPRGPEGGIVLTKDLIENQIGTEVYYPAENSIDNQISLQTEGQTLEYLVTSTATATPRPGPSASQSPGSDFPEEIFGVDEPQSVETSGLPPLFETLDHDELGNIVISANMDSLNTPTIEFAQSEEEIFPKINTIWNTTDTENLSCANPMEIEGRDILDAPIYFEEPVTLSIPEEETMTIIPIQEERPRKKLRLIMPKPEPMVTSRYIETTEVPPMVPTTPEVLDTIERSLQKNSEESIDLLAYVTDSTIKVDDPAFLAFIGNTTPG